MRILAVEDDRKLASYIAKALREASYAVDVAHDGEEGRHLALHESYDLIVLDLMLPKVSGLDLIDAVRAAGIRTPVLVLTARGTVADRVEGLDRGADDYVTKPFSVTELLARVRALLRRGGETDTRLAVGDLTLDPGKRRASRGDRTIELSPKEYALLEYFMRNAEQVVTRTMIAEHVWDRNFESFSNVVDVHVNRLRRKIEREGETKLLHTVRGAGYVVEERD